MRRTLLLALFWSFLLPSAGCGRNADGSWGLSIPPLIQTEAGRAYAARQLYNETERTLITLANAKALSDKQIIAFDAYVQATRMALAQWDAAIELSLPTAPYKTAFNENIVGMTVVKREGIDKLPATVTGKEK